jgi:hypothetical protein
VWPLRQGGPAGLAARLDGVANLLAPYVPEQALEGAANASSSAVRVEEAVRLPFEPLDTFLCGDVPVVDEDLEPAGDVDVVVGRAERDGVEAASTCL